MFKNKIDIVGVLGAVVCLTACGGAATPEPEAPGEEPPEAALMDEPEAASEEDMPAEDATSGDTSGAPASREDIQAAIQLVLQDDALIQKMDLGVAGRFPVKISGPDIPPGLDLMAHEKGAEVVPMPEDPKTEPVLAFTKISMTADGGVLKFRYDVEGLRGTATVAKIDDRWELKSSRVSEYFRKNEE